VQEKETRSHWQQVPQQMCKLETTQKNLQIQEIQKAPQHILKTKKRRLKLETAFLINENSSSKIKESN
jgi:predicted amidophosphoribosyltransferase